MLLISTNLIQLFGSDGFPVGWMRYAWLENSMVIGCAMLVLPELEVHMWTIHNVPANVFVAELDSNTLKPVATLLDSKDAYQRNRVHILRATAEELQELGVPMENLSPLHRLILNSPNARCYMGLEPGHLVWFWDRYLDSFCTPKHAEVADETWTEVDVIAEKTTGALMDFTNSVQEWRMLTCTPCPELSTQTLFTCFEGHVVSVEVFAHHVLSVNAVLQAILTDQISLISTHWIPTLMCPCVDCGQQVTPAYIIRRSMLQQAPIPPVLETNHLIRSLKQKWNV